MKYMIYSIFLLIFGFSLFKFSDCRDTDDMSNDIPDKYFNRPLERQNPSSDDPPKTDAGALPPFKYSFALAQKDKFVGGWRRIVNDQDLPIAIALSGVQGALNKNAILQLHWHDCAEYIYVIYGDLRITTVDPNGNSYVQDVNATDVAFFPLGYPHSIQGTGKDGAFFLAIFDVGDFSNANTFFLLDWIEHTPKSMLATNFGVKSSTFKNIRPNLPIFPSRAPRPLEVEQEQTAKGTGTTPQPFSFRTSSIAPQIIRIGGTAKFIPASIFPVTTITMVIIRLYPGGINELHWHPNADEWQYYESGNCRMNVFAANGQSRTMDFTAGDVGYVAANDGHCIQNTGEDDCVLLAFFPNTAPEIITLSQWLAHEPSRLVNEHLSTGEDFINQINNTLAFIEPY